MNKSHSLVEVSVSKAKEAAERKIASILERRRDDILIEYNEFRNKRYFWIGPSREKYWPIVQKWDVTKEATPSLIDDFIRFKKGDWSAWHWFYNRSEGQKRLCEKVISAAGNIESNTVWLTLDDYDSIFN